MLDNPFLGRPQSNLWFGDVGDLERMGSPSRRGGPWFETDVQVDQSSDPYLMTGYDRKLLRLSHDQSEPVVFTIEIDFFGTGEWREYAKIDVPTGKTETHIFPAGYSAHWARVRTTTVERRRGLFTNSC